MPVNEYVSKGIVLTFSTLTCHVIDVNQTGEKADMVDVTHQGSTTFWREFAAGFKDGGSISVKIAYDPDAVVPDTGTSALCTVAWPAGATKKLQSTCLLESKGLAAALGTKITMDIGLKVTGVPNWAY